MKTEFPFESLTVYKKSLTWAQQAEELSRSLKGEASPAILDQLTRAAMSVPLNIAEGNGRWHKPDKRQFFWVARGSVFECVPIVEVSLKSWLSLAWWGVGTLGLGSALWYTGISRAEGSTAAGFMSIMSITALLLSYFLLNEAFHPVHPFGISLILSSVALMSWVHAREHG